jgi:cytochrome P450 family 144
VVEDANMEVSHMAVEISGSLLLDPKVLDEPYAFYRQLHEQAPVWEIPGTGIYTVSTFDLLAEAASRVQDFSSNMTCLLYRDESGLPGRFVFGDINGQALATADPPLHAIHRNAIFPELVAKRMEELEPAIVAMADELVSKAVSSGTVEFMTAVGNVIPITMISRLIGFRGSNLDNLWESAVNGTRMLGSTLTFDELIEVATRGDEVHAWVADQLSTAREDPGDDLLGAAARGVNDGVLSATEGMGILVTLLSAGGETTTSLLGNAVRMLAEDQDLQAHLRQNPDEVATFAEEALRLQSPFRYLMRSVPEDTSLGTTDIPAGSTVLLLWGAANRDANEFDRPDEIDLGRRVARRHVAFGRGIHHCVGAPLARIEARNVLTILLERTSTIALDDAEPSPRWVRSLLVRRHRELPVRLQAR